MAEIRGCWEIREGALQGTAGWGKIGLGWIKFSWNGLDELKQWAVNHRKI